MSRDCECGQVVCKYSVIWKWFLYLRNRVAKVTGIGISWKRRSVYMSRMGKLRKQLKELEQQIAEASKLPEDADELESGEVFENDEGQGRLLIVDGANYRLAGSKKGQVLRQIFRNKEEVLEHMVSNDYKRQ